MLRTVPLAILLALLCSCRTLDPPVEHIVMVDKFGTPSNPAERPLMSRSYAPLEASEFETHLELLVDRMRTQGREWESEGKPKRAVLYLHGGLNEPRESVVKSTRIAEAMLADDVYPLFLLWDSSLWSCHRDHLFFIRQGEDWGWWGFPLAPIYLATDLSRVVARAPLVWLSEFRSGLEALPGTFTAREHSIEERRARNESTLAGSASVDAGDDRRRWYENTLWALRQTITLPTKLIFGPLLNGVGTNAWNVMQRRIYSLFAPEADVLIGQMSAQRGAVPLFMAALQELEREDPSWEFVLVGHSMGCIVANRALTEPGPTFDRIVHMASAAQISDTVSSVERYLEDHPDTRFHIVTLHEEADVIETDYLGLPPSGSLLVWIDSFLDEPRTPHEQTAGRFGNALIVRSLLSADVLDRVTVKAFSVGGDTPESVPTRHGDFGRRRFWEESFWLPRRTVSGSDRP